MFGLSRVEGGDGFAGPVVAFGRRCLGDGFVYLHDGAGVQNKRGKIMAGSLRLQVIAVAVLAPLGYAMAAEVPEAIASKGAVVVFEAHAVGAQIYECKADAAGRSSWQFREPIAALMRGGVTVGRHYAGPTWEVDGGAVVGKAVARAPGATARDIAWLKLAVSERRGDGPLNAATVVQRVETAGGELAGACEKPGDLRAEPYSAEYRFLRSAP
jgi:hypothetical protein